MARLSFLLADDIHLHARSFGPLFRYIEKHRVDVTVHSRLNDLKRCYGKYEGDHRIARIVATLTPLSPDALFELRHAYATTPLRVYPLCRAEALAYAVAVRSHWHEEPIAIDERAVFDRLYERDRDILLANMAAAILWIDELTRFFALETTLPTHAFVFSGSMTYCRVLLEVLRYGRTRAFVLESTFTGHEFYFEERYSAIANRSDIRLPTVRSSYRLPEDPTERLRDRAKAIQKLYAAHNKNVQQPDDADLPRFPAPECPTLLVVGQVVNDFSILEQRRGWISTIQFYIQIIDRALRETTYNVIFKGHPWEHHKVHVGRARTKEALEAYRSGLEPELRQRLALREHDNLIGLAARVDRVALLSSQAGIELAFHCGLRPSTFGTPFYGGAGFTDDYHDLDAFFADVASGRHSAVLDLGGYDALLLFLTQLLQHHTITDRASGLAAIERRLHGQAEILVRATPGGAPAARPKAPKPPARKGGPKPGSAPASPSEPEDASADVLARKIRKLQRNPRAFFRDAKVLRLFKRWL